MGALRPPNPPTAERGGADFGLCHDTLRPILLQPMSAWDGFYDGGKPPYPPREEFFTNHSAHRFLKIRVRCIMAYAKIRSTAFRGYLRNPNFLISAS